MLLPRILAPIRASINASSTLVAPSKHVLDAVRTANGSSHSAPVLLPLTFARHATHQAQGRANGAKDGPGKRLGAKKSGGEYVIPGNIIFRQRGTNWFPGENCKFGRDHCIFATESGYVRYYRDPRKHPDRQYIGVALEKDHKLPYPPNAARRRRLNMVAVSTTSAEAQTGDASEQQLVVGMAGLSVGGAAERSAVRATMSNRKGYATRLANWEIGRAAEKAGVSVKPFVPGDRWTAWRRSKARIQANIERKKLRNAGKKSGKAKKGR